MSFRRSSSSPNTHREFIRSSSSPKHIALAVRHLHLGDLLDCPLLAIKTPFHPKSSRCPFSECLYTKHFPMHALLDPPEDSTPRENEPPQGKVNRFRRKTRHFPRGWKCQVQRERPVEPVPHPATGESEPFSQEFPALSREVEMPSTAREACGAGTHASRGGKCTVFAGIPGTFPGGGDGRVL